MSHPVKWTLVTYPVVFGNDAFIECRVVEGKEPGHMAWKKCSGGHNTCVTVGFNMVSLNDSKYTLAMNYYNTSQMTYELIIKHFDAMDVNYKYRCEAGFQYALGEITLNEVVALPKKHQITKTFVMNNKHMTALVRIPHVYPRPICSGIFKKRNITNKLNTTYTHHDVLYDCEVIFETDDCEGDLNLSCLVGMKNIQVSDSVNQCPPEIYPNQSGYIIRFVLLGCSLLALLSAFVCVAICCWRRRPSREMMPIRTEDPYFEES